MTAIMTAKIKKNNNDFKTNKWRLYQTVKRAIQ